MRISRCGRRLGTLLAEMLPIVFITIASACASGSSPRQAAAFCSPCRGAAYLEVQDCGGACARRLSGASCAASPGMSIGSVARRPTSVTRTRMAATPAQIEKLRRDLSEAPAILAPLTRGGNLPFRVLCAELCQQLGGGGELQTEQQGKQPIHLPTVSEMIYAKFLLKGADMLS